jgi:hypothetical protein
MTFSSESLPLTRIAGWISARVKKSRQKNLKSGSDSIRTDQALSEYRGHHRCGVVAERAGFLPSSVAIADISGFMK